MATSTGDTDELRVRVTIDREMPELFARLAGSRRPAREVVHLLRMGIQWEQAMSGRLPLFAAMSSPVDAAPRTQEGPTAPAAEIRAAPKNDIPLGHDLSALTGLTADYFAGAPPVYSD